MEENRKSAVEGVAVALWAIFAVIIGHAASAFFTSQVTNRLEYDKWCRVQEDDRTKEMASAIVEFQRQVAKLIARVNLTVEAVYDTKRQPNAEEQNLYKAETFPIYGDMHAAYTRVWLYDNAAHQQISKYYSLIMAKEAQFRTLVRGETVPGLGQLTVGDRFGAAYSQLTESATGLSDLLRSVLNDPAQRDANITTCKANY